MNQMPDIPDQIADEYSLMLLNWAYKKLGDKDKAEELVQTVWLEVFRAIRDQESKGIPVQKMENFIWKIAHYVWCHYLRHKAKERCFVSIEEAAVPDETDFVQEMADSEEEKQLLLSMRNRVGRLNRLQREIIISFYIDDQSVKEIAAKLNITAAAVKWHLFDTRKKLREEINAMKTTEFVYRPRTLRMAANGITHLPCDIDYIQNSLTKQNICIECWQMPRTLDELSDRLGVPKAYLEADVNWLLEREFLMENQWGYSTAFLIETAQSEQDKYAVYLKHKNTLSDVIVAELLAAEEKIREISFYGSDRPFSQLLWMLIYRFCSWQKRPCPGIVRPVRPDGGKYFPLGFDRSDASSVTLSVDTSGWMYNGPMWSEAQNGKFHWFGIYDFGESDCQELIRCSLPEWEKMNEMLCTIIYSNGCVDQFDQDQLFLAAELIEKGYLKKEGDRLLPTFCVFTPEQYAQLEETVFEPIARKLEGEMKALAAEFVELCRGGAGLAKETARAILPRQLRDCYDLWLNMALGDVGYLTTIFAFQDGMLYEPKSTDDGKTLTLLYVGEHHLQP